MRFVEEGGKTVDEAVKKALKKLGVSKEKVKIEVLGEIENKRIFGLGSSKLVKVKVSLLEDNGKNADLKMKGEKILSKILELMNIKAEVIARETEKTVELEIKTENAGILIGKRGQTLNALQELITLIVNRNSKGELRKRFVLDTQNYRKRRCEVLVTLAQKSAQSVIKTKQEIELEPMIPQERYIIHSTLQNYPNVMTLSRGEGIGRRIVILPK